MFNWIAEGANDALKPLISYVDKQWFHKFTPEDWCVYRQTTRTNNDVEGWHNRLNMKARTTEGGGQHGAIAVSTAEGGQDQEMTS